MEQKKRRLEISFGGCGFLGVYHVGVGKCVVDHAPHLFDEFEGFYGASAGALTAVCAACKSDPMVPYKWVKKTFEASRKYRLLGVLHPSFDLYTRLRAFLEEFLPKDAHRLSRDKVKISLTTIEGGKLKNLMVSNFNTRKELINALIASSFIPVYAGLKYLPLFRGKRCFDGGFTSNIPCATDPNVITVSPFSGDCDISPHGESQSLTMINIVDQPIQISGKNITRLTRALVPTSWSELEELFIQGYEDTMRFFKTEGIVPVTPVRPIRRNSTVTQLAPQFMPTTAGSESLPPISDLPEDASEYFSDCGEEPKLYCRSRSHSIAVSTDFYSCQDETELQEGHAPFTFPTSLEEEMEKIINELDLEEAGSKDSSGYLQASWQRLTWLARVPTHLPLISGVCRAVGTVTNSVLSSSSKDTHWDQDEAENHRLFNSIMASWPSSMVMF